MASASPPPASSAPALQTIWTYTCHIFELVPPDLVLWSGILSDIFAASPCPTSSSPCVGVTVTIKTGNKIVKVSYFGDLSWPCGETWTLRATSKTDADDILTNFGRRLV